MDTSPLDRILRAPTSLGSIRLPALGPDTSHIQPILDIRKNSSAQQQQTPADSSLMNTDPANEPSSTTPDDAAPPITKEDSSRMATTLLTSSFVADQPPQDDSTAPVRSSAADVLSAPRTFLPPLLAEQLKATVEMSESKPPRRLRSAGGGIRRRVSSVLKMAGINILEDDEEHVQGLWDVFDVDGDGIIDYAEFCRYTCDLIELQKKKKTQQSMSPIESKFVRIVIHEIMQLGSLQKAIESVFRMLDQNRSGKISHLEFVDGIQALGILEFNYEVHGLRKRFADNSLFLLKVGNPLRYWIVWLVEWKWFDRFILWCIISNSIMLAFRDFQDPGLMPDANGTLHLSLRNEILEEAEAVFSWIFVAESVLKITAMGFLFGRGAYLRSYWNMLDFFVVVVSLIGDLPGVPKISALRTARVLRPLRTLSNLRRMRMLVYALLSAIPALFNVMVILAFVFAVFGILGVLFWNGLLHHRCRATPAPVDGVWALAGVGRLCGGAYQCPTGQFCGSIYSPPPGSFVDMASVEPADKWDYALIGFDNIGAAMLTLFQCITLEGWTSVMYNMQDAHSYIFATVYFVIFTIIGAFFLLQFVFAVIWERFNAANDGTAGEWELILEERRLSSVVEPVEDEHSSKNADVEKRKEHFQRKPSLSQKLTQSVQTGVTMVKQNPVQQLRRIRRMCRRLVENNRFCNFVVFCILLNTVFLAMDEYPVNASREAASEVVNLVLTVVFAVEMVLKLVGLGRRGYLADRLNVFDGFIVCVSLVELAMKQYLGDGTSTGLSALRSFRLFRIMKLARSWRSLRELLQTVGNSLADVANFGLLLLLLMYVFALIGMQFFANKFRFDDAGDPVEWQPHVYTNTTPPHAPWTPEQPYTVRRSNFDDSIAAFTTVFQCLTEENWNSVMYDGIRSSGWAATFYFLVVMVIGNIIILNLFLAILLGNFSVDDQIEDTQTAIVRGERNIQRASQHALKINAVVPVSTPSTEGASPSKNDVEPPRPRSPSAKDRRKRRRKHHSAHSVESQGERLSVGRNSTDRNSDIVVEPKPHTGDSKHKDESSSDDDSDASAATRRASGNPRQVRLHTLSSRPSTPGVKISASDVAVYERDRSLFLFAKRSLVRRVCNKVMHHPAFEGLMLAIILLSSVQLSIDNPLNDPNSDLSTTIALMDNVFTVVFFIEMVLKVVDAGFVINGKRSYLRDPWNVLDFGILISSCVTLFSSNKTLRSLRSLRTLRALRPLRMISRVPGMRRVVNALLSSIPCIMNVFLVCTLIFLVFGIIGVNLFKGRMFYCDMSMLSAETRAVLESEYGFTRLSFRKLFSKQNCLDYGGRWERMNRNYDNVFKSAMTLFEISTTEGWVGLMFQGVDATEVGYHPVENWNRGYMVFFVVFIIIGSFFTLNLFVGAVIDNFNRMRDSIDSLESESETQREWLQIQEILRVTRLIPKPIPPQSRLRKLCFLVQQHPRFEAIIAASVMGNTLMLAVTHFQQSQTTSSVLSAGNIVFWFIFFVEAVIKLMSLGFHYFRDRWNLFDFAVVCGSTVSTVLPFFTDGKISPVANTLRAFRMGLAIRLMKRAKSMQDIVNTILDNLPALVNVSTLLFLIMFVYAVIGVQLYAGVMLGESLDEHANFRGVGVAMVTLFRFATGEAWNDVMYDLMVQPMEGEQGFPYGKSCVKEYSYEDLVKARAFANDPQLTIGCAPETEVVYVYFLTYQLLTSYVLLNLFVAVILEGFEETTEKNLSTVTKADLVTVCTLWEKYDPMATGYVSDHEFLKFLRDLPAPLGLPRHTRRRDLEHYAKTLDLFLAPNGKISFNAFILSATQSLMFRVAAERGDAILPARGVESFFAKSQKAVRKAAQRRSTSSVVPSLMVVMSVKRIQSAMRARIARRRYLEFKKQLAGQRIQLYDQAAMSNFKGQPIQEDPREDKATEMEMPALAHPDEEMGGTSSETVHAAATMPSQAQDTPDSDEQAPVAPPIAPTATAIDPPNEQVEPSEQPNSDQIPASLVHSSSI